MFPFNISTRTVKRVTFIALVTLIVAGVVWGVVYFVTHGRIAIKTPDGIGFSSFSYCTSSDCNTLSNSSSPSLTTQSGKYMVHVSLANSTSYVADVEVKGFMQTTTLEAKSKKYIPSSISAISNQYILPTADGYITYDPDGSTYSTTPSSAIPVAKLVTTQSIDTKRRLFVEYQEPNEISGTSQKVLLYDGNLKSFSTVGEIHDIDATRIVHGSNTLYAFKAGSSTEAYVMSAEGVTELKIPDNIPYATNNDIPIFSANSQYFALVSGNSYISRDDGNEDRTNNPSVLTLYDKSFKKVRSIQLGTRSDISNISFSPDGSNVAVIGEDKITSYATNNGEKLFETQAQNLEGSSVIWRDNNSFIYQLGVGGVYMANISGKEAYSILDNNLLRITDISAIVDNKVYITAFPNKANNYEVTAPSGYVIDLSRDAISIPSVQDGSILRYLPYNGINYTIGYHFDQNLGIVLDVNGSEGSRNAAVQKIGEFGFESGEFTIIFHGYNNPFNTEGGRQ